MKYQSRFSRIFFPEKCDRCGQIIPIVHNFCPHCEENITAIGEAFCEKCGYENGSCFCESEFNPTLPHITAVYMYTGDIRERIHAMKFRGRLSFVGDFAAAMAQRVRQVYADVQFDGVCFAPMTKTAEKERGYNQSRLLAKALAYELSLPLNDCLAKTKATQKQHKLTGQERKENLKGSFSVRTPAEVEGKVLLLCDDIKTTGATLSECANELLSAGAKDVYCICIALADYKGGKE
ncbi:MAG: ComF family protein [Clostridia bacterium]|nr:ComF family protein [Clostridia bacterium]